LLRVPNSEKTSGFKIQGRAEPAPLDPASRRDLPCDSHDAPERLRSDADYRHLVARLDVRGAMARLID